MDTTEHVQKMVHLWGARRKVVIRSENSESDRPYLKERDRVGFVCDNNKMYNIFYFNYGSLTHIIKARSAE